MVFGTCVANSHESQTSDQKALGPSRATKEAVRQFRPLAFVKERGSYIFRLPTAQVIGKNICLGMF
jgi:hypothetical protein